MSDWISVEDKLPVENGTYFVYYTYFDQYGQPQGKVSYGAFYHGTFDTLNLYGFSCKVTHWMSIPKPPKENEE